MTFSHLKSFVSDHTCVTVPMHAVSLRSFDIRTDEATATARDLSRKNNCRDSGMKAVVSLANGDMRKALNILQSTSMAHEEVNEDTVYTCTGELRKRQLFPSSCVAIALHLQMD